VFTFLRRSGLNFEQFLDFVDSQSTVRRCLWLCLFVSLPLCLAASLPTPLSALARAERRTPAAGQAGVIIWSNLW
jgi:hypothetical protein